MCDPVVKAGALNKSTANVKIVLGDCKANIDVDAASLDLFKGNGDLDLDVNLSDDLFVQTGDGTNDVYGFVGGNMDFLAGEVNVGEKNTIDMIVGGDATLQLGITEREYDCNGNLKSGKINGQSDTDINLVANNIDFAMGEGDLTADLTAIENISAKAGKGDHTVNEAVAGNDITLDFGEGTNIIKADAGNNLTVKTGEGYTKLDDVTAVNDIRLDLGVTGIREDKKGYTYGNVTTDVVATAGNKFDAFTGETGEDNITATAKDATVRTLDGNDTIDLTVTGSYKVYAGVNDSENDDDIVKIHGNLNDKTKDNSKPNYVSLGAGEDDVRIIGNDTTIEKNMKTVSYIDEETGEKKYKYVKDGTGELTIGFVGDNNMIVSGAENNTVGFWGDDASINIFGKGTQDIKTLNASFAKGEFKDFGFEDLIDLTGEYIGSSTDTIDTGVITVGDNLDEIAASYNLTPEQTEQLKKLDLSKETAGGKPYYLMYKDSSDNYQIGYRDDSGNTYDMAGNKLNYEKATSEKYVYLKDGSTMAYSEAKRYEYGNHTGKDIFLEREYKDGTKGTGGQRHKDTFYTDYEGVKLTDEGSLDVKYDYKQFAETIVTDYTLLKGVNGLEINFAEDGTYNVDVTVRGDDDDSTFDAVIYGKDALIKEQAQNIKVRDGIVTANIRSDEIIADKTWSATEKLGTGELTKDSWAVKGEDSDWVYDDPLVLDTNKDGSVDSRKDGTGVDINGDGKADGSAANGDKMLAMSDLNGNGKIDGAEVFGNKTISPFTGEELNAANGFEALKMIAQEAEARNFKCIKNGKVDIQALAKALESVGKTLGLISGENTTTLESVDDIKYISLGYSEVNETGKAIQHKQIGYYTDANGDSWRADDIWYAD